MFGLLDRDIKYIRKALEKYLEVELWEIIKKDQMWI